MRMGVCRNDDGFDSPIVWGYLKSSNLKALSPVPEDAQGLLHLGCGRFIAMSFLLLSKMISILRDEMTLLTTPRPNWG
jgi:hypothetical protein